jgi:RNA recognition motif-containing protein
MLPKNVTDTELTDLFSKYGNVTDLQILRGSQQTNKGNILQRSCFPYEWNDKHCLKCILLVNFALCSWLCLH